jgi:hypothetical protein
VINRESLERWARAALDLQSRLRWIGQGLTVAAIIVIIITLIYSGIQLKEINWLGYLPASLWALVYYCISLLIQYFVWVRLIRFHHKSTLDDVVIYARFILMRRLPGGFWHWIGRTALYKDSTNVSGRTIMIGNIIEWAMLTFVAAALAIIGIGKLPLSIRLTLSAIFASIGVSIAYSWQARARSNVKRLLESFLWILIYAAAWALGGMIFYEFYIATGGENFGRIQAIWLWSLTGGSSQLVFFVPGGSGVRELILAWALQPHLAAASSILIGLLIRVSFILGDIIWGSIGLFISLGINRRLKSTFPIDPGNPDKIT